jgi:nucleotide-binding universal stress UspA family protein
MTLFRTILVAADLSEGSREAFRAAGSLSRRDKTRVVVLHVMEPTYVPEDTVYFGDQSVRYIRVPREPSEHEALKERLREFYVPDPPFDVEYWTKEGDAAEEILRASEEIESDLIVMGTHGRTGVRRLLAGSIAEAVLRKARCPVLALRTQAVPRGEEPTRVILHPTDFSEAAETSLKVARLLARDHGARLILLHVAPIPVVFEAGMAVEIDPRVDLDSLDAIRERIDGPDLKHPVEVRLENGSAAFQILRVAEDAGAGLIVMGTHGRSGVGRLLMGSEAEYVLRRACCPVLVVKGPVSAEAVSPVAVADQKPGAAENCPSA